MFVKIEPYLTRWCQHRVHCKADRIVRIGSSDALSSPSSAAIAEIAGEKRKVSKRDLTGGKVFKLQTIDEPHVILGESFATPEEAADYIESTLYLFSPDEDWRETF
jgi:hypothetical protein